MKYFITLLLFTTYSLVHGQVTFSAPDTTLYEYVGQLAVTTVSFPYPADEPIDTAEIILLLSEVAEDRKEAQIATFDFPDCYIFPSCDPETVGRPAAGLSYTEPLINIRYSFCVYKEKSCEEFPPMSNPPIVLDTMLMSTDTLMMDTTMIGTEIVVTPIEPIDPESIPTMSQWGLICLSLILLIFGIQSIKQRELLYER